MQRHLLEAADKLQKHEIHILRVFLVLLLIITVFNYASIENIKTNEKIVIKTLNQSSKFWVSQKDASNEYLLDLGLYIIQLRNNVTASNVDHHYSKLLELAHSQFYADIKRQFRAKVKMIKRYQRNSYTFTPTDTKINRKAQEILIEGIETRWTDLGKKPSKKLRITIKYSIDNATFSFKKIQDKYL
ncbi:hypothetical protein [uncultured Gammaproteobacteria bacterium]|nr:hypothetical protein [uncultured Gammaproteobacteria bacterium]